MRVSEPLTQMETSEWTLNQGIATHVAAEKLDTM
ncbi:MAG: hypothetical protein RUMPE_01340 [Eubacteriales bacterium SKADARSKE-1]|nr:hypothetical protein [Eubacteriales bacterium SKADARSKE-1]